MAAIHAFMAAIHAFMAAIHAFMVAIHASKPFTLEPFTLEHTLERRPVRYANLAGSKVY
jgi:hypothetical protein